MRYCLAILIFLLFLSLNSFAQKNLLVNPGFEKGWENKPLNWKYRVNLGNASGNWDKTLTNSGTYSVKIAVEQKGQSDWRTKSYLRVFPQNRYMLRGSIYTDNANKGSHALEVQWFKKNENKMKYIRRYTVGSKVANKWQAVEFNNMQPPQDATHAIILLRAYEKGHYYWDDIFFMETKANKMIPLTNLSLVSDLSKWQTQGNAKIHVTPGGPVLQLTKENGGGTNPQIYFSNIILKPNTRYKFSFKINSDKFGSHFKYGVKYNLGGLETTADGKFVNEQSASFLAVKNLIFHTPSDKRFDSALLYIRLQDADKLYVRDIELKQTPAQERVKEDVEWKIVTPCYRSTIYPTQSISVIEAIAELSPSYNAPVYAVSFQRLGGKVFFEKNVNDEKGIVNISVPVDVNMPAGQYQLTLQGKTPNKPLKEYSAIIHKLPQSNWEVRIDKEGFVVVNGKRIFLVGTKQWLPPAYMNDMGINTLFYSDYTPLGEKESFVEDVKRYYQYGIHTFDNNRYYCAVNTRITKKDQRKKLLNALDATLNTPGFIGFMADEPLWIGIPAEDMYNFYQSLKELAPNLLGFINHAPRGTIEDLKDYLPCDVTSVDIYPIPIGNGHSVLENKTISCVGDYMKKQKTYIDGRNISAMMCLQGFAIKEQYPTYEELRFMSFQSIVYGAKGLIFWVEQNINLYSVPEFFDIAHKLFNELRNLAGLLTLSDSTIKIAVNHKDIACLGKESQDKAFLICVNESREYLNNVQISYPRFKNTEQVYVLSENRQISSGNEIIKDDFGPYDVHIYGNTKNIPLTPSPRLHGAKDQRVLNERLKQYIKSGLVDTEWKSAKWIWPGNSSKATGYVRREFVLDELPSIALLNNAVITHYYLYVNGKFVDWDRWYYKSLVYDITKLLKKGKNTIAYRVKALYGPDKGLLFKLIMEFVNGNRKTIVSDHEWLGMTGNRIKEKWYGLDYSAYLWKPCSSPAESTKHNKENFRNSFLYDYK